MTATPGRCASAPSVCSRAGWTAPSVPTAPCPACRRTSFAATARTSSTPTATSSSTTCSRTDRTSSAISRPRSSLRSAPSSIAGIAYGHTVELEVDLAERIVAAVESVEMVRFVTSGTEAAMSAVRLARAATGRDRIVKFAGGYHGHADALLAEAGSGIATLGIPGSPGVPAGAVAGHGRPPVQRPRGRRGALRARGRADRRRDRGTGRREHGMRPSAARVSGRTSPAAHPNGVLCSYSMK